MCNSVFLNTSEYFFKKLNSLTSRCKSCSKLKNKENYIKHRTNYLERKKEYWQVNKERISEYRDLNRNRDNNTRKLRLKEKRTINCNYSISKRIGSRVRNYFKSNNIKKRRNVSDIVGCSIEEFRDHLILSFESMYGVKYEDRFFSKLHIDHIIPISSANSEYEIILLNHYSNLQLLFYKDNIIKCNNIDWKFDSEKSEFYSYFNIEVVNG